MLLRTFHRGRGGGHTPARPMTAGRLVRRMLLVAAITVAVFLSQRGAFNRLTDQYFGSRIDWHNDYAMSEHLYDLVVRRRLTDAPRACLLLNIHGEDPPSATNLDMFERPTPACMGPDAGKQHTLPRLFGLRVDRDDGTIVTDSGTPNQFHPLR